MSCENGPILLQTPNALSEIKPLDPCVENNLDILNLAQKTQTLASGMNLGKGGVDPHKKPVNLDIYDAKQKSRVEPTSLQEKQIAQVNVGLELFNVLEAFYAQKEKKAKAHAENSEFMLQQIQEINQMESFALKNKEGIDPEKNSAMKDFMASAKKAGLIEEKTEKLSKKEVEQLIKDCEEKKQVTFKESELESSKISPLLSLLQTITNIQEAVFKDITRFIEFIMSQMRSH